VIAGRCNIREMSRKSRDRNHAALEALMIHGHIIAASRGELVWRDDGVGRAGYASQTDLDRRSST
jgi:hypothetical protein